MQGVLVCLVVYLGLVLREVGCNSQDFRADFGSKKSDCKVRLVMWWYVDGLNGWVGILIYREYSASREAFGVFVVEGWIIYYFLVTKRVSPK